MRSPTPGGSGSVRAPTPPRGAPRAPPAARTAPCKPRSRRHGAPGPATSPAPRRRPHPHPQSPPVPGSPARASSLPLRGGTLASYSTRALVGSGSKHSTFSPEWNLNFMPSLALICSSWRRARLRGGRSARGGGGGWGRGGGAQRRGWGEGAGNGGGCGRPALSPASARPAPWPDLGAAGSARSQWSASPRVPPGSAKTAAGNATRGHGLPAERPLPGSWERWPARARPAGSSGRARALWPGGGRRPGESVWGGH